MESLGPKNLHAPALSARRPAHRAGPHDGQDRVHTLGHGLREMKHDTVTRCFENLGPQRLHYPLQ